MNNQSRTIELVRREIRRRALSRKTENAYLNHIRKFLDYFADGDLSAERAGKISCFLEYLKESAADSTRNQARCALLFLYRDVLGQTLSERFDEIERVAPPAKKHEVFSHTEAKTVLGNLRGACFLVAALMYGSGLRLPEAVRLRIRDIDFEQKEIKVREARTGAIDRTTVLPASLEKSLRRHLVQVNYQHDDDCMSGFGKAVLPAAILRQFPQAADEFGWHYLFPAAKLTQSGGETDFVRLHLAESTVQKAFAESIEKARIEKRGGCQTLRYSFASRLFEFHCGVHTISRLLGHKNLKTTLNYFGLNGNSSVISPLD